MEILKYKTFPKSVLDNAGISKGELAKWMGVDKVTFDVAVPQGWLNKFVEENNLNYGNFLSTIMYMYPTDLPSGIISGCTEYDNLLGNYSGRYDGKWEREDCDKAPEGTVDRERDILRVRIKKAIEVFHKNTGDIVQRMEVDWEDDGTFEIDYLF